MQREALVTDDGNVTRARVETLDLAVHELRPVEVELVVEVRVNKAVRVLQVLGRVEDHLRSQR